MASRSGKMHIESQNNQLEKEDKIAGVVDPICAKKPLHCALTDCFWFRVRTILRRRSTFSEQIVGDFERALPDWPKLSLPPTERNSEETFIVSVYCK